LTAEQIDTLSRRCACADEFSVEDVAALFSGRVARDEEDMPETLRAPVDEALLQECKS
jgi:hypothetical protein